MDEQIRALADPRRRRILELVQDREMAAGQIAARFQVTRPAISQHLTVLKRAGLIDERREGTRRLYRAQPAGLLGLKQFVDRLWTTGLARLKDDAEAGAATGIDREDD
ncbi:MAG: metalloregulator ArsR/SmtB family transcription factor [Kribbellaceae bacterium]